MDWVRYQALADSPGWWTRWLLQQTLDLLGQQSPAQLDLSTDSYVRLQHRIRLALQRPPLPKPAGFKAGAITDLLILHLSPQHAESVVRLIHHAQALGLTTPATRARGLGGMLETWSEYLDFSQDNAEQQGRRVAMADAEQVVLELIDGFNQQDMDKIVDCFTPEAVYHNIPMEAVTGPEAIRGVLAPLVTSSSRVQWDVLAIASNAAGQVLTERVDKFETNGKWITLPVMGVFEVSQGKITAWRDYFDLAQFTSQMPG